MKYLSSSLMSIVSCLSLAAVSAIGDTEIDFYFLQNYRFYLYQITFTLLLVVQLECRKCFSDNLQLLNFSSFLTIAFSPLIGLFIVSAMEFKNTIEVNYSDTNSMIMMCLTTLALTLIYYAGKLSVSRVCHFKLLIMNIAIGSFSSVFCVKLMQEYDPYSFLFASNIVVIIVFVCMSLMAKENIRSTRRDGLLNQLIFIIALYCLSQFVNMEIVTKLPAEQYTCIKCAGMVLVGYVYYYVLDKKVLFSSKDFFILLGMIGVQFAFAQ